MKIFEGAIFFQSMTVDLIKLVVGIDTLEDFAKWQSTEVHEYDGMPANVIYTRNRPRQEDEILSSGGSAYRVIKGKIRCRQEIIGFDDYLGSDGKKRCIIFMKPEIIETYHVPHRPFQGWRYLKNENRPKDVGLYKTGKKNEQSMPAELAAELREAGLL